MAAGAAEFGNGCHHDVVVCKRRWWRFLTRDFLAVQAQAERQPRMRHRGRISRGQFSGQVRRFAGGCAYFVTMEKPR